MVSSPWGPLGVVGSTDFGPHAAVFEQLGLIQEERLEVYRAVAQLVKERLVKARSV